MLADIILAGGVSSKIAGGKVTAKGVLAGAGEGAKAGATLGAIAGGAQGSAHAAQEDQSAGKIIGAGVLGATGGAILGGTIGGVTGALSGYANKKAAETAVDHALKLTMPKKVPEGAKTTAPGIFAKSEVIPQRHDQLVAESVADIIAPPGGKPITSPHLATDAIQERISQDLITMLGMRDSMCLLYL